MAATTNPLVWDFYRLISSSGYPGETVHYLDEEGQDLYLSNGIQTLVGTVPSGQWEDNPFITDYSIDSESYLDIDFDHPYNGVLYGVALTDSGDMEFLRYVYLIDCTQILQSSTLDYRNDSAIVQYKANVLNTDPDVFINEVSLFQPGAKATLRVKVGDEQPYPMCVLYLDSIDYLYTGSVVPISARNGISKLVESTFDDSTTYTGMAHEVAAWILSLAGITDYAIQTGDHTWTWNFDSDQTLYMGLQDLFEFYPGWKMVELPTGKIVVGYNNWISQNYQSNGYYVFNSGEVFKRSTKQSSDAAYKYVRVTGKDSNNQELTPETVAVQNYTYWQLPSHKTYHVRAPDGYTQSQLADYAQAIAESLQYIGIGESISGPFRPQLLVGDVAAIEIEENQSEVLGIITSIRHKMGKTGFYTEFTTDSGGVKMDEQSRIVTTTKAVSGYNRRQTLKDLIEVAARK